MTISTQLMESGLQELGAMEKEVIPSDILAVFQAERALRSVAGVPRNVLPVGSLLDGVLLDVHGQPVTLRQSAAGRMTVVAFYRGAWCPYCCVQLRIYQQELLPELRKRNIELIAVSPQKPDGSLSMNEKEALEFTVLSDPGNEFARQVGILDQPQSERSLEAQREFGFDVMDYNMDGTSDLPMPTVILIDPAGIIRYIDVQPSYTRRTEPSEILRSIDEYCVPALVKNDKENADNYTIAA